MCISKGNILYFEDGRFESSVRGDLYWGWICNNNMRAEHYKWVCLVTNGNIGLREETRRHRTNIYILLNSTWTWITQDDLLYQTLKVCIVFDFGLRSFFLTYGSVEGAYSSSPSVHILIHISLGIIDSIIWPYAVTETYRTVFSFSFVYSNPPFHPTLH
jgi:hypothetical protein